VPTTATVGEGNGAVLPPAVRTLRDATPRTACDRAETSIHRHAEKGTRTMNADELRSLQAPIKERYRDCPDTALITLRAQGRIGEGITCKVETGKALVEAGLHPGTGGDGIAACSGDMLLEALVACAGVTLRAVATALGIELRDATVQAEGDLDFRGTLGVAKEAPVGFQAIRLRFELDTDATEEQRASLLKLTERYCVIYQTLTKPPPIAIDSRVVKR
jgi:uncharacterized OsmC-like protein